MSDGAAASMRIRLAVLVTVLIALALGSFWVLQIMRNEGDAQMARPPSEKHDYYVDDFVYVRMALDGTARYSITGKRMEHFPNNDSFTVATPFIRSLDKAKPPMLMHSDRALIEDNNSKIHMRGNAFAERDAAGKSQKLTIASEYLLLLPDDDQVTSDQPVKITLGASVMNGVGMIANNATMKLELQSQVRGTYYAKPR